MCDADIHVVNNGNERQRPDYHSNIGDCSNRQAVLLFYKYFVWSSPPNAEVKKKEEGGEREEKNDTIGDQEIQLTNNHTTSICQQLWWNDPNLSVEVLSKFQHEWCIELQLKGRILIAEEGINGTVSGNYSDVELYIERMKQFDLMETILYTGYGDCTQDGTNDDPTPCRVFEDVDWKLSTFYRNNNGTDMADEKELFVEEPFPDLKISRVKEIVSTGGIINVKDLPSEKGRHLTPEEFHEIISASQNQHDYMRESEGKIDETGQQISDDNDDGYRPKTHDRRPIALIDVRNTFEHNIGHFVHPGTGEKAMDPQMVTFSSFDKFCEEHAEELKHRKVLMYCTGGIRCEKASVMLKRRGVQDVNQLSGGIHRYLEKYGKDGHFKGINFTFDKRVAMKPGPSPSVGETKEEVEQKSSVTTSDGFNSSASSCDYHVVGRCVECTTPYDELCGSRLCTVCRDLVLVCPTCQNSLREYHCQRHSVWKDCYFTFLEIFDVEQLTNQLIRLRAFHKELLPATKQKNARRTLARQIEKVETQIQDIKCGKVTVRPDAPRRCRYCLEPNTICDGLCWGFWKKSNASKFDAEEGGIAVEGVETSQQSGPVDEPLPISVGDRVQPGKDWNTARLGHRHDLSSGCMKTGTVVQVKSWAGHEQDCVVVMWDSMHEIRGRNQDKVQPQIYRWGVLMADQATRAYDVCKL